MSTAAMQRALLSGAILCVLAHPLHARAQNTPPTESPLELSARAPVLRLGLPAADSFSFSASGSSFRGRIPIQADSAGSFRVEAASLVGPGGIRVPLTMWLDTAGAPDTTLRQIALGRLAGADLVLEAELPGPGAYRGSFHIRTSTARVTRAFTVTWGRRSRPIVVTGAGSVAVRIGVGGDVRIPFALHDTSGSEIRMYAPALDELRWHHGADTSFAVTHGSTYVRHAGRSDTVDLLVLEPNATAQLEMVIRDALNGPGLYSGSMRVAGPDFQPFTVSVRLHARRGILWAIAVIALGILVAEVFRHVRDRVRPRLERQRNAAQLSEWLEQFRERAAAAHALDESERRIIAHLTDRVGKLYDGLPQSTDQEAYLADLRRRLGRLPGWLDLNRRIRVIEPDSVRAPLQALLLSVTGYLLHNDIGSAAMDEAAGKTMSELPGQIRDALREHLLAQLDEFDQHVKDERELRTDNYALLADIAQQVQRRLKAARALASENALEDARAAFQTAQLMFVELMVREMQVVIAQAPSWLDQAAWTPIAARVGQAVATIDAAPDAEQKIARYERSRTLLLTELSRTLAEVAGALLASGKVGAGEENLESARTHANEALMAAAGGDIGAAATAYDAARSAWDKYQSARSRQLGKSAQPIDRAMVPAGVPEVFPSARSPDMIAHPTLPLSSAALARRAWYSNALIFVLAGGIATVLGIQLLWVPDLSWGTLPDMLTAFLWGLGLQQVGSSAFGGLVDITRRVGGQAQQGTT